MIYYVHKDKNYLLTCFDVQDVAMKCKKDYEDIEAMLLNTAFTKMGDEDSMLSYIQPRISKANSKGELIFMKGYKYPVHSIQEGRIFFSASGEAIVVALGDADFRVVLNEQLLYNPNMAIYDEALAGD